MKRCVYCGDPVLPSDWYSVFKGHCLERAMGMDCAAWKGRPQNDREPRSGGSAAGVEVSQLHDKPDPTTESTR